ncbi:hypothetical protein [Bacillus sp. FJAT-42315]|uniref:hypothetical protein n=1 Tax=Bacillus sp. FJAT-42315 TaxID=2014077 RepID=UPI000B9E8FBE|nr:hypothetical protein [Bacillus sp. FJAT-42315]OZI13255.1 hypothetical protein CEW92_02640 [Bacillaceae bacterium SAS-127]PAQ15308.1 hypothetical protein CD798_07380 [Bacillaceae bacterium SAOS 7]
MVVVNLLDSRNYFDGEIKEDFLVIYEKLQHSQAVFHEGRFGEVEGSTEEYLKVLHNPGEDCSLMNVKSYKIGQEYKCLDDALNNIKEAHREIFK